MAKIVALAGTTALGDLKAARGLALSGVLALTTQKLQRRVYTAMKCGATSALLLFRKWAFPLLGTGLWLPGNPSSTRPLLGTQTFPDHSVHDSIDPQTHVRDQREALFQGKHSK